MNEEVPEIHAEICEALNRVPHAETLINEARFGYRYVFPELTGLRPGSSVLEIGSGAGVLLAQIKYDFEHLRVAGVEPIGPGFEEFRPALERLQEEHDFELHTKPYERLPPGRDQDLIFLVNVFEHLDDWRHFLRFARSRLKPGGRCIILCPNYGFPYESHFYLPVLLNKRITERVFRDRIRRFEEDQACAGLWKSLNFVKWSEVRRFARQENMNISFDARILGDLISRLDEDKTFAERQRTIAGIARLARRSGALKLVSSTLFWRWHPYMLLTLQTPSLTAG